MVTALDNIKSTLYYPCTGLKDGYNTGVTFT